MVLNNSVFRIFNKSLSSQMQQIANIEVAEPHRWLIIRMAYFLRVLNVSIKVHNVKHLIF